MNEKSVIIVFIILLLVVAFGFFIFSDRHVDLLIYRKEQYKVWVKQTGNPAKLTYEEYEMIPYNQRFLQ